VNELTVLRIHHFLPLSYANGPGRRAVLWVQRSTLACPGCYTPHSQDPAGGESVRVDDLFQRLLAEGDGLEGLTVSGGEPLQQLPPLLVLLRRVRRATPLSTLLLTGYTFEEVQRRPRAVDLLDCLDVLIAGCYDQAQRLAQGLRGSANKTVHLLTARYTLADLEAVPTAEVVLDADGQIELSGIAPLRWPSSL
jgi:anaerobic ribonucleoside-triphosphate reductase activating protein